MKKLLSICFLSILLSLAGFVAQAQSTTPCCFWLENMNPQTVSDVSNVGIAPGDAALLPGHGNPLVLNNTMTPVTALNHVAVDHQVEPWNAKGVNGDQVDWYKVHVKNCGDANTKVSLEWKLYNNGVLIPDANLADYVDLFIYTRFDQYANTNSVNATCGHRGWLGGPITGESTCREVTSPVNGLVNCLGGYPGAAVVDNTTTFTSNSFFAGGYVQLPQVQNSYNGSTGYNLDFFYLPFFESSETRIALRWRQVGNYSLVVNLRERVGGTDYQIWSDDTQNGVIGGHQSCCGNIIASDSIHYLVTEDVSKEVCDGSAFMFGRPEASYTTQGEYKVVFGDSTCDHFKVEKLSYLHFFVRENPEVVVVDTLIENCFGNAADPLLNNVKYATPDAPGLSEKKIQWSVDDQATWADTVPATPTAVGTYVFYVRQVNTYYNFPADAEVKDTVVCDGPAKKFTYIVHEIPVAPEIVDANDYYCVGNTATTVADNAVTTKSTYQLRWSRNNAFEPEITGADLIPSTAVAGTQIYYVYQIDTVTKCYDKKNYDSVVVVVVANPDLQVSAAPKADCLGEEFTLTATPAGLTSYSWKEEGTEFATTAVAKVTPTTAGMHVYTVDVTKEHVFGKEVLVCEATANDTITVYPLPTNPKLNEYEKSYCLNELEDTYTIKSTTQADATTIWFNEDRDSIFTGANLVVDINSIKPATNKFLDVKYLAIAYNPTTGCYSDTVEFVFHFNMYPVVTLVPPTQFACPGTDVTIEAQFLTESAPEYTPHWLKDAKEKVVPMPKSASPRIAAPVFKGEVVVSEDSCTGATYTAEFYVVDGNNCVSDTVSAVVIVKDTVKPVLSVYTREKTIEGCDLTAVPAPYTTVTELEDGEKITVEDPCGKLIPAITYVDQKTEKPCNALLVRTYTISDNCGNDTTFTITYTVHDSELPVITATPVQIDPIPVMECKYNLPQDSEFTKLLIGKVSDNCATPAQLMSSIRLTNGTTTPVAEANTDIFAAKDTVDIYATISDLCGNKRQAQIAFLVKPTPMFIHHGSVSALPTEICLHDTVNLEFAIDSIDGYSHAPYSFVWTGKPNDGSIIHHTLQSALGVPGHANDDYVYTITVTDKYGCVAKDSSEKVHVWDLPTVTIHEDIRNGATFPLCPNYGVLTVEAVAHGMIPSHDEIVDYTWSGESVNIYSHNDTTGVYIIPDSCNHAYNAHVVVTNVKGCHAETDFPFMVMDTIAPAVVPGSTITDSTLTRNPGCKFYVPNFIPLFSNDNVVDNCYRYGTLTVAQNPVAGTEINRNTPVTISFTDRCGNVGFYVINANIPTDNITVTNVANDNAAFCLRNTVTFTPSIANGSYTPLRYAWTEGTNVLGTDFTFTVTPSTAGVHTYTFTVTDANDCESSMSTSVEVYRLPEAADVTLASTPNNYCDGIYNIDNVSNGTVSTTALTAGFQYKISTDTTWRDADYVYTGLHHGHYSIDLKSDHDCITFDASSIDVDSVDITVLSTATGTPNHRCEPVYDGTITVNNPQVNYTYEIINVPNTERVYTAGDLVYDGLRDGDYAIHVVTDKYCPYIIYNTIVGYGIVYPELPSYDVVAQTSCTDPDGSLTIHNTTAGYQYTFGITTIVSTATGSDVTFDRQNGGYYTLTIKSTEGCEKQFVGIEIPTTQVYPERPLIDSVPNSVCDPLITANGSIRVINPIHGYKYEMGTQSFTYDSAANMAVVFTHLIDANNHLMTITSDLGCKYSYTYELPAEITLPGTATFDKTDNTVCMNTIPSCVVVSTHPIYNGTLTITNTDATRYEYSLASAAGAVIAPVTGFTYENLVPGLYVVSVRDIATGCIKDTTIEVLDVAEAPAFDNEYVATPRTSCLVPNGCITINPVANYEYFICAVQATSLTGASNLDAGKYEVFKYNKLTGCSRIDTVEVPDGRARYDTITAKITPDITCDNNLIGTGSIEVTNLSTTDFTFFIDGARVTSNVFNYLQDGSYVISVVHNATSCPGEKTFVVPQNVTDPVITATTTPNTICTPNVYDGTITITPEANCVYVTVAVATGDTVGTTLTVDSLAAGDYVVNALNVLTGCTSQKRINVQDAQVFPVVSGVASKANYSCKEFARDGSITLSSVPTDVTYYVVTPLNDTLESTSAVFAALNSGDYTFFAITPKGCVSNVETITVADSAHIYNFHMHATPNTMCVGTFEHPGNGTIIVDSPRARYYDYSFYDAAGAEIDVNYFNPDSYTMYHLKDQLYRVVITDTITTCSLEDTITVPLKLDDITVKATATNNDHCEAPWTGTITVALENPNIDGVYRYSMDGGAYQISNVFTGVQDGLHEITVWDTTTNCVYPATGALKVTVDKTNYTVDLNPTVKDNEFCRPPYNGEVTLAVTSDVPGGIFEFEFDTATTFSAQTHFTQLDAGVYNVRIKETTTGCIYEPYTVTVKNVSENKPIVTITTIGHNNASDSSFCYNADGTLIANVTPQVSSDTLGYLYSWSDDCHHVSSDSSSVKVYTEITSGYFCCTYTVEVTSIATGCKTIVERTICVDSMPDIKFFVENPSLVNVPKESTVFNCENDDITIGILNPLASLDSISWTNAHVESNVTSFVEPAGKYVGGQRLSYCVWVVDHHGCTATSFMNLTVKNVPQESLAYSVCDSLEYKAQSGIVYKYKYIDGAANVYTIVDTFVNMAANGCDSVVTYTITVNTSPELTVDSSAARIEAPVCHGNPMMADDGITAKYTTHFGWKIVNAGEVFTLAATEFDPTAPVKYADNGKELYAYAYNGCDTLFVGPYTLTVDSLPVVGNISDNSPYCYNAPFDLVTPTVTWNNSVNTGVTAWQMNGVDTVITNFVYDMNNATMHYAATNNCGTTYSNDVTIKVYNEPKVSVALNTLDSICVGTTDTIFYTLNESNLHKAILSDNGFKVKDVEGKYYLVTADSVVVPISKLTIVAYQDSEMICATDTAEYEFTITDKPVVGIVANPDSVCAGNAFAHLVAPTVNPMNGVIYSQGWYIDASATGSFDTPFDPATKLYMSDNGKFLKYAVENRCGKVYSNAVPVIVDTLPTAQLAADPTEYCAGAVMVDADFTLTGPTVTPTAPIIMTPHMVLGGVDYTGAALTMLDSAKTLVYEFSNRCGTNTTNAIKILVHDTASLELTTLADDSICVGATETFTAVTHRSNVLTITPLDAAFSATITKVTPTADGKVYTITLEGVDATVATSSALAIKVVAAHAECTNDKFDTVRFVITDTAHFSAIAAVAAVCEGDTLVPTIPAFTTPNTPVVAQYWQSNVTGAWTTFATSTPMTREYNNKYLRYAVETRCGTVYSDSTRITVNDTVKLTSTSTVLSQEICSGTAIADVVFDFTAETINFTMNPATISGLADSIPTTTSPDKQYIVKGGVVVAGFGTYTGTVSAKSSLCPATNKTMTFEVKVDSIPAITFNTAAQTYCIGETPAFKVGEVVTLNSYDVTDSAVVGYIKTTTSTTWSDVLPTTITADLDSAYVAFTAKNHCGESPIYDSLLVIVKGLATVTNPVAERACTGSQLIEFIKTYPTYTLPTASTSIVDSGWAFVTTTDTLPTMYNTVITKDTNVLFYVETECGTTYSETVALKVKVAPEITSVIPVDSITICDGGMFKEPLDMTYINDADDTTITWTIQKVSADAPEVLDFSLPYDTSYNNAVVSYIVANECGADTVKALAVVYNLPVPQLLADTNICSTGTAHLQATPAAGDAAYVSYKWYMDDNTGVVVATTASFDYTSLAEGVHTFTVEVVDANGCVSVRNDNATYDKDSKLYKSDKVTVNASDLPRFIFKDVNGNETHRLPDAVTSLDINTYYTWEVSTPCFDGEQLVFVTFDIYHNNTLIDNTQIGEYLMERLVNPTQPAGQKWVTSDKINWFAYSKTPMNVTTYYDFASGNNSGDVNMGNHYPNTRFGGGAGGDMFDDIYLHFLNDRPIDKTVAPFVQAGEYDIIYTLYYVDNTNRLADVYWNEFGDTIMYIGGRNSLGAGIHAMVVDTLKITVTGPTQVYSHGNEPIEPEPIVEPSDEPTVVVYPNPTTKSYFSTDIEGLEGDAVIRLVNVAGVVISEEPITPTKAAVYTYTRTTTDLTPGVYFVYVQCGDIKISKKLVVAR